MFEYYAEDEYAEVFSDPGEADGVITEAREKLCSLLSDGVKETIAEAKEAAEELVDLRNRIVMAKAELIKVNNELAAAKAILNKTLKGNE